MADSDITKEEFGFEIHRNGGRIYNLVKVSQSEIGKYIFRGQYDDGVNGKKSFSQVVNSDIRFTDLVDVIFEQLETWNKKKA